jgi:hypothetical protein
MFKILCPCSSLHAHIQIHNVREGICCYQGCGARYLLLLQFSLYQEGRLNASCSKAVRISDKRDDRRPVNRVEDWKGETGRTSSGHPPQMQKKRYRQDHFLVKRAACSCRFHVCSELPAANRISAVAIPVNAGLDHSQPPRQDCSCSIFSP